MKNLILVISLLSFSFLFQSCSIGVTTEIGENTFVRDGKVYRIIRDFDGEIKKVELLKQRDLGNASLSYVKNGAYANLKALYRGNYLYYSMTLIGLNDMKENYSNGALTIAFKDDFGSILHSIKVQRNELIGMVGDDGKVMYYHYDGKAEMSTDINSAIKSYEVSSSIKKLSSGLYGTF